MGLIQLINFGAERFGILGNIVPLSVTIHIRRTPGYMDFHFKWG
jgi:hypothetical protein